MTVNTEVTTMLGDITKVEGLDAIVCTFYSPEHEILIALLPRGTEAPSCP